MRAYTSNQDLYNHIDDVTKLLRSSGHAKAAEKIHYLIHKVAWTTSSELFGELRNEFSTLLKSKADLPEDTRNILKDLIKTIDNTWNQ